MKRYDAVIIGAGAAGMYCAIHAAKRGLSVAILEKNKDVGSKLRVCGGGRCNITNLYINSDAYLSQNPRFCRSALARHTQWDFLQWFEQAGLTYHEKKLGQLFCDQRSKGLINTLKEALERVSVDVFYHCSVQSITPNENGVFIASEFNEFQARKCIIASGGPSFPKLGATDNVLQWAKKLKVQNIPFRPALVPFILNPSLSELSGISCLVKVQVANSPIFEDQLLFTHKGLSGPAILQISSYWQKNEALIIDFLPMLSSESLVKGKKSNPKMTLHHYLQQYLAVKLVDFFLQAHPKKALQMWKDQDLKTLLNQLKNYEVIPQGTEGLKKAEVCLGGINTIEVDPRTFELKKAPNIHVIGESLDVTGWLGGYNLQWAWSSAWCCAQAL